MGVPGCSWGHSEPTQSYEESEGKQTGNRFGQSSGHSIFCNAPNLLKMKQVAHLVCMNNIDWAGNVG